MAEPVDGLTKRKNALADIPKSLRVVHGVLQLKLSEVDDPATRALLGIICYIGRSEVWPNNVSVVCFMVI
jgi:hypothetical protein